MHALKNLETIEDCRTRYVTHCFPVTSTRFPEKWDSEMPKAQNSLNVEYKGRFLDELPAPKMHSSARCSLGPMWPRNLEQVAAKCSF